MTTKSEIISRHLINPELIIHDNGKQLNYTQFCLLIDRWKRLLLEQYNAKPGERVMIEFDEVNSYYYSAVFAAFELGLVLIGEWAPAFDEEDVVSHRMTMHGRIHYAIIAHDQHLPTGRLYNYWNHRRTTGNCNHIITEVDMLTHDSDTPVADIIHPTPNDDAVWSASGGTTGLAKQVKTNHRKILAQSTRLVPILGFKPTDHCLHFRNLLYGAGTPYYFIPSWITCREHTFATAKNNQELTEIINNNKINKVNLFTAQQTTEFLQDTQPIDHDLIILSGFVPPPHIIPLVKEKNVQSVRSCFGDTTIGLGFFTHIVDQTTTATTYQKGYVGRRDDDFYDFEIRDGFLYISIPSLGQEWRTSYDRFECRDGAYYFFGRGNQYRIGRETVTIGDLDIEVDRLFGPGATIVVDDREEKIYLSVWKPNPQAEEELNQYFATHYEKVQINQIARHLDPARFTVARKIDREKLRDYFRYHHLKPVTA